VLADGVSELNLPLPGRTAIAVGGGHFHVYLAAAAGAGKTIAMLDEGQPRQASDRDLPMKRILIAGRAISVALAWMPGTGGAGGSR
jgi:hypothetical protein